MILIITEKTDIHINPVVKILDEKNIGFFRLNTDWILEDYSISYNFQQNKCEFIIKDLHNQKILKIDEVKSVWERRPTNINPLTIKASDEIRKLCEIETNEFLRFLRYDLINIFSLGHSIYDRSGSSKILQLRIAQSLGLRIPLTCFSNDKKNILNCFKDVKFGIVIKPIDTMSYKFEQKDYTFYTNKINLDTLFNTDETAFNYSISFLQEYIPKEFELRITVVCNEVFACKIDSQLQEDETGKVDWRQGYDFGLKYSIFELPEEISTFCKDFLKLMKINFGCFDFIVTPEGEYVFLECNSNGQWLWIEEETGLPIASAISNALIKGSW